MAETNRKLTAAKNVARYRALLDKLRRKPARLFELNQSRAGG